MLLVLRGGKEKPGSEVLYWYKYGMICPEGRSGGVPFLLEPCARPRQERDLGPYTDARPLVIFRFRLIHYQISSLSFVNDIRSLLIVPPLLPTASTSHQNPSYYHSFCSVAPSHVGWEVLDERIVPRGPI